MLTSGSSPHPAGKPPGDHPTSQRQRAGHRIPNDSNLKTVSVCASSPGPGQDSRAQPDSGEDEVCEATGAAQITAARVVEGQNEPSRPRTCVGDDAEQITVAASDAGNFDQGRSAADQQRAYRTAPKAYDTIIICGRPGINLNISEYIGPVAECTVSSQARCVDRTAANHQKIRAILLDCEDKGSRSGEGMAKPQAKPQSNRQQDGETGYTMVSQNLREQENCVNISVVNAE